MTGRGRNDFSEVNKRALALRAGYRCSLANCGRATAGPSSESPSAVTVIGVAAHICAASPGGRRYVEAMTPEQRSHITNAIWLCSDHATLIDRDAVTYTIERLHEIKRRHEMTCAQDISGAVREARLTDDLLALGPAVICTGELVGLDADGWSVQVRHFVDGDVTALVAFVGQFKELPRTDRYLLVNTLGEGRMLSGAPTVKKNGDGYLVTCPIDPPVARIEAQSLGRDFSVEPETNDLHLDRSGSIAVVSGLEALPQRVRSCLSLQRGESPFYGDLGVRIAHYFDAFQGSPWLAQLVKLEVIRQATIPYYDGSRKRDLTPLQCVERVRTVEALADAPKNQWLPIRVEFDVHGVGSWKQELSVCMPSTEALARIKQRQDALVALGFGRPISGS